MKRFYIIPLVWVLTVVVVSAQSTDPITNVLLQIADHNPEVREARLAAEAAKQESGAGNNLADPTVSYTRQWGKPEGATSEVITELEVLQSFDFPTAYIQRNKLHNLQKTVFDSEAEAVRQRVLLQAKELCIDIIALRQTQVLLRR
ncbi:MAG: TolC family protein, partial [Prevotellaceae bacterium]|nr:TolC family protein [Prevotellaceae bacterium]